VLAWENTGWYVFHMTEEQFLSRCEAISFRGVSDGKWVTFGLISLSACSTSLVLGPGFKTGTLLCLHRDPILGSSSQYSQIHNMQLCNSSWSYRLGRWPPKIRKTYERCLVALKRQDVQHRRNGLYLTSQVTHSAATGSNSRASLGTQQLHAVSHEPGYALSCNGQYLTSQVTQSAATGSISRARLRTQLLQTASHEPGYVLRCNGQYLTSQVTHSATIGSSTGRMWLVCQRPPVRISVVTTILAEIYCSLSQSLQTSTKKAH